MAITWPACNSRLTPRSALTPGKLLTIPSMRNSGGATVVLSAPALAALTSEPLSLFMFGSQCMSLNITRIRCTFTCKRAPVSGARMSSLLTDLLGPEAVFLSLIGVYIALVDQQGRPCIVRRHLLLGAVIRDKAQRFRRHFNRVLRNGRILLARTNGGKRLRRAIRANDHDVVLVTERLITPRVIDRLLGAHGVVVVRTEYRIDLRVLLQDVRHRVKRLLLVERAFLARDHLDVRILRDCIAEAFFPVGSRRGADQSNQVDHVPLRGAIALLQLVSDPVRAGCAERHVVRRHEGRHLAAVRATI